MSVIVIPRPTPAKVAELRGRAQALLADLPPTDKTLQVAKDREKYLAAIATCDRLLADQ